MNESMYTQGVGLMEPPIGSYSQNQPEHLGYPDNVGSSYLTQFGTGYGSDPTLPPEPGVPPVEPPPQPPPTYELPSSVKWYGGAWYVVSTASIAASAYHGYKRNESIGWAL